MRDPAYRHMDITVTLQAKLSPESVISFTIQCYQLQPGLASSICNCPQQRGLSELLTITEEQDGRLAASVEVPRSKQIKYPSEW